MRETHLCTVLLAGERAIKLLQPIDLPFVHAADLAHRRELCKAEARLNLPFAPRIYRGARALVRTEGGLALASLDAPEAIDLRGGDGPLRRVGHPRRTRAS
jgi:aminoglycoside phosphotransferase family enzyme